jgi:O-succinylbenzoic acid--CoA ligase
MIPEWLRGDWIEKISRQGDGRPALRFGAVRVDYRELAERAEAMRRRLSVLGVEEGDLVAILAPPSIEGVVLLHAMLASGIVILPLNARLSEAEQRDAIESTRARFLVVPRSDYDGPTSLGARLVEGSGCGLLVLAEGASGVDEALAGPVAASGEVEREREEVRSRRLAENASLVIRTSGTSGRPKGAVLTFDNLISSAKGAAALLGSQAKDRWLLCMPLFHIGGLSILIRSAMVGATVLLHRRFDAEAVARSLEEDRVTHVSLVATMLQRVLERRGDQRSPESLSLILVGGGPAPEELLARAEALGYPIAPTYGLTEAASQVATRPPDRVRGAGTDRSAGLEPLPGVEIRIVDAQRHSLPAGREGEIEVKGPIVMKGYLDDSEATSRAIREGWLSTGDVGRLDPAGRLRVLDRRADLIVSGGENVYPAQIESMLLEWEGVAEAGVFGIPDAEYGSKPVAFVVMKPGQCFDREALVAFCRERMASYARPCEFSEVAELPRTATGKLLRRTLREQWEISRSSR